MGNLNITDILYLDRIRLSSHKLYLKVNFYLKSQKPLRKKGPKITSLSEIHDLCFKLIIFNAKQVITIEEFEKNINLFNQEKYHLKKCIQNFIVESYNSYNEFPYVLPANIEDDEFYVFFYNTCVQFELFCIYLDLEFWYGHLFALKKEIFPRVDDSE